MNFPQSNSFRYYNFIDSEYNIYGIAKIKKGCDSYLHWHKEPEIYYILYGSCEMILDDTVTFIRGPKRIDTPSYSLHCLSPVSSYVLLLYYFPTGPFHSIQYNFISKM